MPLGRLIKPAAMAFASFAFAGCAMVGPDYVRPEVATPPGFFSEREHGLSHSSADFAAWWERFGDATLNDLVKRAMTGNLDLREAYARIDESRGFLGAVVPDLYPTLDVDGAYSRSRMSVELGIPAFGNRTNDAFGLGLGASWEVDLWGRVRRNVEAARADVEASVEDARAVLVSLVAETANAYVELRTAQERARIVDQNIGLQQGTLDLSRARFQAGLEGELDVAQALSALESTRSTLPPLQAAARASRNRIAVLLGVVPGTFERELSVEGTIPAPPVEIAVGVPADLLTRRPDIRRSERLLAAETARIGVAEGDLYPRVTLGGNVGIDANDVGSLFSGGALNFGVGPAFTWNVFDRDRLHARVASASARARQAAVRYERDVLRALEEVENGMTSFVRDQVSQQSLEEAIRHTRRAVELSQDRYRQGLVNFQSVIDTQRRLFQLEDTLAITRAAIATDAIFLFRALGGGWESRPDQVDHDGEER